jgi:hypothetical protein
LGEIGLDRFHLPAEAAEAEPLCAAAGRVCGRAEIARGVGVPVVVHSRGAFRECVEMIDASGVDWSRVVFHCFSEGAGGDERPDPARWSRLVHRRDYLQEGRGVRAAAKAQGLARLMIETDAPYLAPVPHRGKPNEPAYVRHTAEYCAGLFGVSYDELAAVTTANATDSSVCSRFWPGQNLGFVELAGKELIQLGQHLRGIVAHGDEPHLRAFAGGQHHQAHDALPVHLFLVLFHENVAAIFVGDAHDHGGRPGMNAHLVLHDELSDVLLRARCGFDFVHEVLD